MKLPRISLRSFLYFFLLVVVLLLVVEGGYFLGIKQSEKKAVVTEKEEENEIEKYASSSIYYLFGTLSEVRENTWTIRLEETETEITIKDELTEYPPTYFTTEQNKSITAEVEEIGVGDNVRIEVAITPEEKWDVLSLTKLSQ